LERWREAGNVEYESDCQHFFSSSPPPTLYGYYAGLTQNTNRHSAHTYIVPFYYSLTSHAQGGEGGMNRVFIKIYLTETMGEHKDDDDRNVVVEENFLLSGCNSEKKRKE
jgi:hypothetical protein